MAERILIVDDEILLLKSLQRTFEQEGFTVEVSQSGDQALARLKSQGFDLIILDLMLPGVDGLTVCREVRQQSDTPIIMLTAKGDDVDKIIGLELGADDYLVKPFNTRELLARARAVLRRTGRRSQINSLSDSLVNHDLDSNQTSNEHKEQTPVGVRTKQRPTNELLIRDCGRLVIDLARRQVFFEGRECETLTSKEFDLFVFLAANPGRVYTREQLLDQVWGYEYIGEHRTVDVHIRRLRDKVEPESGKPYYIRTRWGVGYYFGVED
jgi:two-component system response regulator VicR